jgi:protein CpxP
MPASRIRTAARSFVLVAVGVGLGALIGPAMAFGPGGHGGAGGFGPGSHGELTEEVVADRIDFATRFASRKLDLTGDQQEQLDALLADVPARVVAHRNDGKDLREAFRAALTADVVDAEAMENLRVEALARADEGTAEALELLVDVANVLTPDQRAQMAEFAERHHR